MQRKKQTKPNIYEKTKPLTDEGILYIYFRQSRIR
jgi:hypothetical protein